MCLKLDFHFLGLETTRRPQTAMNFLWIFLYLVFLGGLFQSLSFIERSAALRGTGGEPIAPALDKGLRVRLRQFFTITLPLQ